MNAIAKNEVNHAEQNAAGWYSSIAELVAALEVDYDRIEELRDEREGVADAYADASHDDNGNTVQSEDADDALKALNAWEEENGDELRELTEAATIEGEVQTDADAVRDRIQESPLSVEVRSGWYSSGSEENKPEEFCILLSTGGPALRLCGDLDEHGTPTRAYLQYQDWGTPWTDYYAGKGSGAVLLTFAQQFYFAE